MLCVERQCAGVSRTSFERVANHMPTSSRVEGWINDLRETWNTNHERVTSLVSQHYGRLHFSSTLRVDYASPFFVSRLHAFDKR